MLQKSTSWVCVLLGLSAAGQPVVSLILKSEKGVCADGGRSAFAVWLLWPALQFSIALLLVGWCQSIEPCPFSDAQMVFRFHKGRTSKKAMTEQCWRRYKVTFTKNMIKLGSLAAMHIVLVLRIMKDPIVTMCLDVVPEMRTAL